LVQKTAASIVNPALLDEARQVLQDCHTLQVDVLDQKHRNYPQRLREIYDSPTVLYQKGVLLPQDELAIGIVGSRRCTAYGRRQAERMAASLSRARGFTIVSGLARGIDGAAHRGALKSGGRTLAILASGVKTIYPPEHKDLAEEISQQGALLSEMPLEQRPAARAVPSTKPNHQRHLSGCDRD
jgi:DNA processing protein